MIEAVKVEVAFSLKPAKVQDVTRDTYFILPAGLAVDFSLHYAVSYKACISEKRMDKVKTALQQMGGPTLMAAITSGAAGAFMLPSRVLAYIQIGVFLLLVMTISWIYATLFMCPTLAVVGPSSHFAQFKCPRYVIRFFLRN